MPLTGGPSCVLLRLWIGHPAIEATAIGSCGVENSRISKELWGGGSIEGRVVTIS
jgi:hypothetical protein